MADGTSANAPFFYVYLTALVLIELSVGGVLALRSWAESSRRMALLACAYAWSAPLAIVNTLTLPGVHAGFPYEKQLAPWIWIVWHVGWAIGAAAYAFVPERAARHIGRVVPAVFVCAIAASALMLVAVPHLPPLLGALDAFLPTFRIGIALALTIELIAIARLVRTRPDARDAWVLVALLFAAAEATLQFSSGVRFSAAYYSARVSGLLSGIAILGALITDALALWRRDAFAEAELARLAEFRVVADAMPQIVWQLTTDGRTVYANARWSEYTGYAAATGSRDTEEAFADAIHPDDRAGARDILADALREQRPYETTFRLRNAAGGYRYFLTRAVPLVRGNLVSGWVGSSTDIDDQRRDTDRMRTLATIGRALSTSLEIDDVLEAALHAAVPSIADWAVINLFEKDRLVTVATYHRDPEDAVRLKRLVGGSFVQVEAGGGSLEAMTTNRGIVRADVDESFIQRTVRTEWVDLIRSLVPRSLMIVPLLVGGEVRGTFSFNYARSGRSYQTEDVELLEELGRRVAIAIDNAQRYAREHRVSDRLQRGSLPSSLPTVPGLSLDAVYQAGNHEAQIGGDWYDAFVLDDGRVAIGVGDVMGTGLEAAVTMNAMRHAIRGAAEVAPNPVMILNAVDRALTKDHPERLVTALIAFIDLAAGTLSWASAGHPPPFLRLPDGRIERLDGVGLPLGLRLETVHDDDEIRTIPLVPGALLILYTDGLTEARRDPAEGEERLATALSQVDEGRKPAGAILNAMFDGAGISTTDDVAILTVHVRLESATALRTYVVDSRRAYELAACRRAITGELAAWGLLQDALGNAELVIGELLGNVVRHAPGRAEVTVDLRGAAPIVTVSDRGIAGLPRAASPDLLAESGRGLHLVAALTDAVTIAERPGGGSSICVTLQR